MNYTYRKLPVLIEAFQITRKRRESNEDWPPWLDAAWNKNHDDLGALYPTPGADDRALTIRTRGGPLPVPWGHWIIRGIVGELYPCDPVVFDRTYQEAFDEDLGHD